MRQLVAPDPNVTDGTGWCLRFAQSVFGAAARYPSAWESWLNGAAHKHRDRNFPAGSAVPLWFEHWGTYGGVYANWGHVVVRFPDGRYLSSPAYGHGRLWLNSIEEVERTFNCTYVGWSEDINSLRVFDTTTTPKEIPLVATPAEIQQIAQASARAVHDLNQPRRTVDGKDTGKVDNLGGVLRYEYAKHEDVVLRIAKLETQGARIEKQNAEILALLKVKK